MMHPDLSQLLATDRDRDRHTGTQHRIRQRSYRYALVAALAGGMNAMRMVVTPATPEIPNTRVNLAVSQRR